MADERCDRCGLRRMEADERCYACGSSFEPAAAARRGQRDNVAQPRIRLGLTAMLAPRELIAPAGTLTNVARFYLGGASAFILALWACAVLLYSLYLFLGLWVLAYTLPFVVYPALSLYCCVRRLPSRKVGALGLVAHLYMIVSTLFAHYVLGERAVGTGGGATSFGWALTLSFVAAWVALYAGRLMDEGRLRVGRAMQATLGVVLVASTAFALVWSHASDRRARERHLEEWSRQRQR